MFYTQLNNYQKSGCLFGVFFVIAELCHYIQQQYIAHKIKKIKNRQPCWWPKHPSYFVKKIYHYCQFANCYQFEEWFSGAFLHAKNTNEIHKKNYKFFLAWYLYTSTYHQLTIEETKCIKELTFDMIQKFNLPIQTETDVCNETIQHCALGVEPIYFIHQPLVLTLSFHFIDIYNRLFFFHLKGFRKYRCETIDYWYYSHPTSKQSPFFFLHGIGIGWNRYLTMISEMMKARSVILICYDGIVIHTNSMKVENHLELNQCMNSILERHKIDTVSLIAHSWGTFLASWLIKLNPQKISYITLLDPVALFVHFPQTVYVFAYKKPETISEWMFYLFVRKNIKIVNLLSRNFAWYNSILEIEDIPENIGVLISISTNDELLHIPSAMEMLDLWIENTVEKKRQKPIEKLYWDNFYHGDVKDKHESISTILNKIEINDSA